MEEQELDLDFDKIEEQSAKNLQVKERFSKLSTDLTAANKAKAEVEAKAKAVEDAKLALEKERDFYKNFSQISSQHPNAIKYQDQILEKVRGGYSPEDATYAVLGKEGMLGGVQMAPITEQPQNVAGGSAATAMPGDVDKPLDQMSRDELRNALLDREKQGEKFLRSR